MGDKDTHAASYINTPKHSFSKRLGDWIACISVGSVVSDFSPSPAGMSLTKLSLVGNTLIFPSQGEFGL
jgi:hypothetical protein